MWIPNLKVSVQFWLNLAKHCCHSVAPGPIGTFKGGQKYLNPLVTVNRLWITFVRIEKPLRNDSRVFSSIRSNYSQITDIIIDLHHLHPTQIRPDSPSAPSPRRLFLLSHELIIKLATESRSRWSRPPIGGTEHMPVALLSVTIHHNNWNIINDTGLNGKGVWFPVSGAFGSDYREQRNIEDILIRRERGGDQEQEVHLSKI